MIYSIFSVGFLIATIFGIIYIVPAAAAVSYETNPVIFWATSQDPQTEITIAWKSKVGGVSQVWYGTESTNLNLNETDENVLTPEWHNIALTGLQPNTRYYYSVVDPGINSENAKIFSFTTAPSIIVPFSFLVTADVRQNSGYFGGFFQPNVPKAMEDYATSIDLTPAFTMVCGDTVAEATNERMWKSWFDDISTTSNLGCNAPLQITIGNHERYDEYTGDIFEDRYGYENRPNFYYSYNYSNLHVQCLDPWSYDNDAWESFSATQLDWIENDLQAASSMDYKVVFLHPPPVKSGEVQSDYQDLVNLCTLYDVDAVFFGHVHRFEHTEIDGVNYFMVGVGGNDSGAAQPPGFAQVNVDATSMSIEMHWLNGTEQALVTIPN